MNIDCQVVQPGYGILSINKDNHYYYFAFGRSPVYHEPMAAIPREDEAKMEGGIGFAFSDWRSVQSFINSLTQLRDLMLKDEKKKGNKEEVCSREILD